MTGACTWPPGNAGCKTKPRIILFEDFNIIKSIFSSYSHPKVISFKVYLGEKLIIRAQYLHRSQKSDADTGYLEDLLNFRNFLREEKFEKLGKFN